MYSDIEALKKVILKLLNEKNITVNKLATQSGLAQSTLDSILKGKSKNPQLQTIKKIAAGFGIPQDTFLRMVKDAETDPDNQSKIFLSSAIPCNDKALFTAKERLRWIRLSKGIALGDVLDDIDVPTEYEKGQFGMHPVDTLVVLANYFNVSLDYLTGRNDNPSPYQLS